MQFAFGRNAFAGASGQEVDQIALDLLLVARDAQAALIGAHLQIGVRGVAGHADTHRHRLGFCGLGLGAGGVALAA